MENINYTNSNVKYLRELNGIPQSKLASDLKIDQSTLAKWENGTRQITLEWAIKLSNYFNIDVGTFIANDLLHNTSSQKPNKDEQYKQILKNKGLMDDHENISEENFEKLIDFAIANKDFIIKKDKD